MNRRSFLKGLLASAAVPPVLAGVASDGIALGSAVHPFEKLYWMSAGGFFVVTGRDQFDKIITETIEIGEPRAAPRPLVLRRLDRI